jgi:hypothetical protein
MVAMKKARLNAIVDLLALVLLVPTMLSGVVTLWILPLGGIGYRGGAGLLQETYFWGLSRQEWRDIHDLFGLVFFLVMAVHLLLHWRYFRNVHKLLQSRQENQKEA